jgi:hypothetical protein
MSEHLDTALVDTWFAAWSRSRGYRTSPEAERRAALRHRVEISDDLARELARSLRELAGLKRRPAHG